MNRNNYFPIFLIALTAGLIGGGVSRAAFASQAAFAQNQAPRITPATLRAHVFELVDSAGRIRGVFAVGSDDVPAIRLYDANGNVYWSTGKSGMLPVIKERP